MMIFRYFSLSGCKYKFSSEYTAATVIAGSPFSILVSDVPYVPDVIEIQDFTDVSDI